jgi:predicted enzyme related to lactoylglutathione lyase
MGGADVVTRHGRFVWYELITTDVAAAATFYAKVVGWSVWDASTPGRRHLLFSDGKTAVGGLSALPDEALKTGVKPNWIGYVDVDDVDTAAARVKLLGGAVHVPPTTVADISRFSIVADPQTARFALFKWLRSGQEQPPEQGAQGRVGWHELVAADIEQACAFYGGLFAWQAEAEANGTYRLFSVEGQAVGGVFTKPMTVPLPFWLYYFNIGDVDATAQRVRAGGGQVLDGPFETAGGRWVVLCTDPQGAIFALEGKRSPGAIGYFEGGASRDRSGVTVRRWSW